MIRSLFLLGTITATCLVASPAGAQTCDSLLVVRPHAVDVSLQAIDHTPPNLSSLAGPTFRSVPETKSGCLSPAVSSCATITFMDLPASAVDDMTPADKIGYRLSLESGTLPSGLVLPSDAVDPEANGYVRIAWDNAGKASSTISFTLRVVAVDAAGNESAPHSVNANNFDVGCEAVAPPAAGPALLALLLAARRRARRRHRRG